MNTILTKRIHTLAALVLATSGFVVQAAPAPQPPRPPGTQPPAGIQLPPPPNSTQPPQNPPGTQPPPPSTGTQPPQNPPGTQPPPPPTGTQPPQNPPGTQPPPPPPTGTQPPQNPPGTQPPPPRPTGTQPPQNPPGTQPPPPPPGNQPPPNPPGGQPPAAQGPRLGAPLAGLTPEQLAAFREGLDQFVERETPATGLGPAFNNVSCVACHRAPAPGGASRIFVTRFGKTTGGVFDPLEDLGGSLLQANGIAPGARERIPAIANTVAHRETTPLFGLGLIEAIPDEIILQLAERPSVDGVKGHAAMITDIASGETRVGRFGWKNQQATLLSFSGDAYLNEMGITNRLFPNENAPNGNQDILARFDRVPELEDHTDPVTGRSDIDALADFQRLLAPPAPLPLTARGSVGRAQFTSVGCAVCHVPQLQTGASDIAALDHQTVALYSDLLLHDMGSLGDGIAQADASPTEFRTPPLWGLRASAPYLHDGRAATVDAAIRAHDGEGKVAAGRYKALSATNRAALLEFLGSL